MKEIKIKNKEFTLRDDAIVDFFEKEVTPHGTGAKIPCSSKYIGKRAYVIITENEKGKKKIKEDNSKD